MGSNQERFISYDEAVGILNALVIEKGAEFVYSEHYESCVNWDTQGQPRCIVGHLVGRKGWIPDLHSDHMTDNCTEVAVLFEDLSIDADDRTMGLLSRVQMEQDQNVPWGDAVQIGVEYTKDGGDWMDEQAERNGWE